MPERLTTSEAAELAGIAPTSLRSLVTRGTFPRPDGHFGRTPWWRRETVERWRQSRHGPGRPSASNHT